MSRAEHSRPSAKSSLISAERAITLERFSAKRGMRTAKRSLVPDARPRIARDDQVVYLLSATPA